MKLNLKKLWKKIFLFSSLLGVRNSTVTFHCSFYAIQHAYMLRKNEAYPTDYSDLIIGIAKISTQLGLKWLGNNDFLTVSSLFPAAYFDSGYEIMLKRYPEEEQGVVNQYGSIQILTD